MLYNILYYAFFSGIICLGGSSILYICDRDLFDEISMTVSWETVKLYHKIQHTINNNIVKKNDDIIKENIVKKNEKKNIFIGFNKNDETIFKTENLNDSYIKNSNFDLMMMLTENNEENKTYIKTLMDKNNYSYEIEPTDKLFLQVEIEQYDSRNSIHKYLEPFYVRDNKILDEVFLKWYVKEYFNMMLAEDYVVHIIDSNVNMFKINKNEAILIVKTKDDFTYKIITNNI